MGFYSSHTLIDDVKRHGVPVFAVNPNLSGWDCRLERASDGRLGIRVGFCVVHGMIEKEARALIEERERGGPFASLGGFVRRARIHPLVLERLALGDAFASFGLSQRQALWEILAHRNMIASENERAFLGEQFDFFGQWTAAEPGPESGVESSAGAGSGAPATEEETSSHKPSLAVLPPVRGRELFRHLSFYEAIQADYQVYGLSTRGHPMEALRKGRRIPPLTTATVRAAPSGRTLRIAGLVIARQKPPNAKGTAFATLEDEDGFVDLVLHADVLERYHEVFVSHAFLLVSGRVQADKAAVSLIVRRIEALEQAMRVRSRDFY